MGSRTFSEKTVSFRSAKQTGETEEYCKGWIDNLKIYNRALTEEEIQQVPPQAFADVVIPQIAASIQDVTIEDAEVLLPNYSNTVTWKSQLPEIIMQKMV